MAERRMFAKTIIDSDAFLDMPTSAQALYFHMAMRADDDGFLNNPKKVQRMVGASDDDCKLLLAKRFLIAFESGVVVIKHWRIHNYIQKDRYKPTVYQEEKASLSLKDNGVYTECIQDVYTGKYSIDKDSIDKDSIDNTADKPQRFIAPTAEEVAAYCRERNNNVDPQSFIDFYDSKGWMIGKNKMKDWKAAVRTWEKRDAEKPKKKTVTAAEYKAPTPTLTNAELWGLVDKI